MLGDTSSRTNSSTGGIALALTGVTQASLIKDDVEMGGTGTIPGIVTSEAADCVPVGTQSDHQGGRYRPRQLITRSWAEHSLHGRGT